MVVITSTAVLIAMANGLIGWGIWQTADSVTSPNDCIYHADCSGNWF